MASQNLIEHGQNLPETFDVSVILEQRPSPSPWADNQWEVVGVSAGSAHDGQGHQGPEKIFEQGEVRRYKVSGFKIQLHADECESYYHNLMSDTPRCFVIADAQEGEAPDPFLVSLSFDEAHAYLEGEEAVFAVDIPPELYRWSEAFVLAHYVPEKRTKRKLKDWSETDGEKPGR